MSERFSEESFLRRLFPQLSSADDVLVGPGDDCAVIKSGDKSLVIGVDQVIEGRHYLSSTPAKLVGRKLMARNLSDIAAMGARPRFALLSSASSQSKDSKWLSEFHSGVNDLGEEFGVCLIGGDLAVTDSQSVASLTIVGEVDGESYVCRNGANSGDLLFATGSFGNSFESEHHLKFSPRVAEGVWLNSFGVTSMMDVTDGLLQDASKLAASSGLSLVLDESAVILRSGADVKSALCEGEDYELIFSLPKALSEKLYRDWDFPLELKRIGSLEFLEEYSFPVNCSGENLFEKYGKGFDHFND